MNYQNRYPWELPDYTSPYKGESDMVSQKEMDDFAYGRYKKASKIRDLARRYLMEYKKIMSNQQHSTAKVRNV